MRQHLSVCLRRHNACGASPLRLLTQTQTLAVSRFSLCAVRLHKKTGRLRQQMLPLSAAGSGRIRCSQRGRQDRNEKLSPAPLALPLGELSDECLTERGHASGEGKDKTVSEQQTHTKQPLPAAVFGHRQGFSMGEKIRSCRFRFRRKRFRRKGRACPCRCSACGPDRHRSA